MLDRKARRTLRSLRAAKAPPPAERPPPLAPSPPLAHLDGWGPVKPLDANPVSGATFIGRVPVFDRRRDIAGFSLVVDRVGAEEEAQHSRQLLTRALLEVGLDSLIGGRIGFIEVTVDLLADGLHHALPAHRMIIEVVGDIDRRAHQVLSDVRADGYRLMLGSLAACDRPAEALRTAGGLRIDLHADDLLDTMRAVERWHPRAKVLVDHLSSPADIEPCLDAGATWIRGDILRPMERIDEPTVPANRIAVLELLSELERADVTIDDIDRLVSIDLGMSYKLLRMANSSYLALERRVERTRDAIVYLGLETVRASAALMALAEASDHPPEIVHLSLLRARHCSELLSATHPTLAHAGFTAGLFSSLHLLLGLTVDQVLDRIPVSDVIADALRARDGVVGRALATVIAYEKLDTASLPSSGFDPEAVIRSYRSALHWIARLTTGLDGRAVG